MTIKNFKHLQNSIWDWAILDGCFGDTKIKISDIDGFAERNGHFLILECKFRPSDPIPTGQEIAFKKLAQSKLFTIIVLWGDKSPEAMKIYYANGNITEQKEANLNDLRNVVSWWYKQANEA